jgi:plastocyanin
VSQCGSSGAAIAGNHGHVLVIPASDLDSTVDKTYSILGMATHDHSVTFTPAQLQMLKAGQEVTVTSTETLAHDHNVRASCA